MSQILEKIALQCLNGAENNTMSFPEILSILKGAGFDGYMVDFRRKSATYYMCEGGCIDLPITISDLTVAELFQVKLIQNAIHEAQQMVDDYSYRGFCQKVTTGGCAGYIVSLSGERAVYFGRSGEMHTEYFPQ